MSLGTSRTTSASLVATPLEGLRERKPHVFTPRRNARIKPNSITLAGSEPAPNYSSELAPNMFGASSELASVMEFGLLQALY